MLEGERMGKSDAVTGLILFVFGVMIFIGGKSYPFGSIKAPGPGFLPRLASVTLIALSMLIIISSLKKKGEASVRMFFQTRDAPKRVAIAVGAFFAYRLSFPILGFVSTNFIFFLLISRLLGHHGWKASFIFSFLTTVLSYLLFQVWLNIQMPTSIFGL